MIQPRPASFPSRFPNVVLFIERMDAESLRFPWSPPATSAILVSLNRDAPVGVCKPILSDRHCADRDRDRDSGPAQLDPAPMSSTVLFGKSVPSSLNNLSLLKSHSC